MPSAELYKDKVEVSLDGRQIFYLFFGGVVIVGMVFVLGVLVGRRVEARGHVDRARTHAAADPLAALDRLEGSGEMAFRGALSGDDTPTPVEQRIAAIEKARDGATSSDGKASANAIKETKAKEEREAKDAKARQEQDAKDLKDAKAKEEREAKDAKAKEEREAKAKLAKADAAAAEKKDPERAAVEPASGEAKPEEPKQRYTLQLSSFQDKAEADTFLASVRGQGFQAKITQAEVEGRGTFYRVRLGTYRSMEAATAAKAEFEKSSSSTASIMKL